MHDPIRTALIYGSVRPGRFCDTIAHWAAEQIWSSSDFRLDLVDLRTRADFVPTIGAADAFVVVTYDHAYTAPLKMLIDSLSAEWRAKPVGFVSYGGISGGLRAVEHLRGVFAELHAVSIHDGVRFANARAQFDDDGRLREPETATRAMTRMLRALGWWARALRNERRADAYADIAA